MTINPQLQARLKRYKDNANSRAESVRRNYPNAHPEYLANAQDWKQNRYPKPAILKRGSFTRDQKDSRVIYADSFDDLPFIQVGEAHEVTRLNYTGWYTSEDDYTGEVLRGFVLAYRNPHKLNADGAHLFYIAAIHHSDWDGVTVYADCIHDTPEDAARYADECARVEAEQCRFEDAVYQQEQRITEAREELHAANKATLELIREAKQTNLGPAVCAAVRQVIRGYLADRAELLKTIQTGA
jgi:hypothetical protein